MIKELKALIFKDLQLEWRHKYALNGMLLYVVSTSYVCYAAFKIRANEIDNITWNTIFWIIMLFTSLMAVSKSFNQEREGRLLYLYTLTSAESVILSKIIFNSILLVVLGLLAFGTYSVFMGNPVASKLWYTACIILGAIGFASTLSLVAGIASKAENSAMLMAILSFPIIIPLLLLILKISKAAMDGLDFTNSFDEILILASIDAIVVILSVILYPYLWRS